MSMWTGLLKWSLAYHDGTKTGSSEFKEMSKEDKEFLLGAMDSMVVDEVKRMRIICEVLKWPEDPKELRAVLDTSHDINLHRPMDQEGKPSKEAKEAKEAKEQIPEDDEELLDLLLTKKEDALEELDDRVCVLDNAIDFVQLGGLPVLLQEMKSKMRSLRNKAAQAFATIVQNNPKTQQAALDAGGLDVVFAMLEDNNASVITKGLTALSAFIRCHEPAERAFVAHQGLTLLNKLVADVKDKRARAKAVRLLGYTFGSVFYEKSVPSVIALKMNFLNTISGLIGAAFDEDDFEDTMDLQLRESSAVTLSQFVTHEIARAAASEHKELQTALGTRINLLKNRYTSMEEVDMIKGELDALEEARHVVFGVKPEENKEYTALTQKRKAESDAALQAEIARKLEQNIHAAQERKRQDDERGSKG